MDALDAACQIRDYFLDPQTPKRFGEYFGSGAPKIELLRYYFGLYYTPFNPYLPSWSGPDEGDSPEIAVRLPYLLSVWFNGGPNLMKLRWGEDGAHLLMMQRGPWESDFGFSPFENPLAPDLWRWRPHQVSLG